MTCKADPRIARAEAAIGDLTVGEFIGLVGRLFRKVPDQDAEIAAPLSNVGLAMLREGTRLAVIQEQRHGN
ncbi:MAG: hypothetical protein AAGF71_04175 [Pseudomonadota bacterium]